MNIVIFKKSFDILFSDSTANSSDTYIINYPFPESKKGEAAILMSLMKLDLDATVPCETNSITKEIKLLCSKMFEAGFSAGIQ